MFLSVLIISFVCLLLLNVPVVFAIGLACLIAMLSLGQMHIPESIASDMVNGIDSFSLLAIPLFILAGEIMGAGGLALRLINLAKSLLGKLPGGLSLINTLTCMLFGSISGSALAAVSSIGKTLIPEMEKNGYSREFSIATTVSGSITGVLIPPSNVMIVFCVVASGLVQVSVSKLFLAGIIPGLMLGFALMMVCFLISKRRNFGAASEEHRPAVLPALGGALPSLMLLVIVLGGIFSGWFTPTEASAVAVVWSIFLACVIYRDLSWKDLPDAFIRSAKTTGMVLLLVAVSVVMSRILTEQQIPQMVSQALLSITDNRIALFLIINLTLLLVGTFMDITPAILIFTPIFLPVALDLGMDPYQFGIVLIANLSIGLCTPPVGTCLFLGCSIGKGSISAVSKEMIPFYFTKIIILLLLTFIPLFSTQFHD